jgi:1-acyl-sn-glycerol-3-phosphate acyltransferase
MGPFLSRIIAMSIFIQIKAIFLSLFLLFFVLFPVCLLATPFPLARRLKIVCPVWAWCGKIIMRHVSHSHIDICEDHRSPEFRTIPGKGIYIANHQSFMDIPLMLTMHQVPPIMKKEVLYIPIFGWLGWISGAMPVSRSRTDSRKKVFAKAKKRILGHGIGVQVYPEGTRSKTADPKEYREIKRTLLMFAFNEKIPVVAVSMYGTRGIISPQGFLRPNRHVGIILHKEIDPKDFSSAEEFCSTCWNKVREGHFQMKSRLAPLNENLSLACSAPSQ